MSAALVSVFEGAELRSYVHRGRPCWIAAEAGRVAGYADGARFVDKIRGPWRKDFVEGKDIDLLRGTDLAAFREVPPGSGESSPAVSAFAGRLLILYESGVLMGLLLARTEKGRRLRRFIVDEVLPQLLRTGRVVFPGAPADPEVEQLRAENATLRARLDDVIGEGIAGTIGDAVARAKILEPLDTLAQLAPRGPKSGRRYLSNLLRNELAFNGRDTAWRWLPRARLWLAERRLGAWRSAPPPFPPARPRRLEVAPAPSRPAPTPTRERIRSRCGAPSRSREARQLAFAFIVDSTPRGRN